MSTHTSTLVSRDDSPRLDPDAPAQTVDSSSRRRAMQEVTDVTGVQAGNAEACDETPDQHRDVTNQRGVSIPESERPCWRVFDEWSIVREAGHKLKPGVWYFEVKQGRGDSPPTLTQLWICSPLHLEAVTHDAQSSNFGRLLRFRNTLGQWRKWAMPMELLKGHGDELRGVLLSMGTHIAPNAHRALAEYLQANTPHKRMRCALQTGWSGDVYILPDEAFGAGASDVAFQTMEGSDGEFTTSGTLEGWRRDIATRAIGNPLLMLAISASFVGPLLAKCHGESGGVHLVGDSSTGKTTAIEAACATWGGPNYRRSWRATANGMEGVAALFNDGLLALDEISECDPREVGSIIYALGNGRGKQRAGRTGNARPVTRWRCFVLSSGERTIATAMQEGGQRAKAGQSVRLLDVPASRIFGAWDTLHDAASPAAFSDSIKVAASIHYGHAGREYLRKLTTDKREFTAFLDRLKALPNLAPDDTDGQPKRAAARFALIALAGELATEYGLTGWPEGAAVEAAAEAFKLWQSTRGRGNDERRQILGRVTAFIERHGDSRFSNADADDADTMRIQRAGWWRGDGASRVYLFNAEALREALQGFDFNRALDVLQKAEVLPETCGERARPMRIAGRVSRLYMIHADKLGTTDGA